MTNLMLNIKDFSETKNSVQNQIRTEPVVTSHDLNLPEVS